MKIEAACFTARGQAQGEKLAAELAACPGGEAADFRLTRCGPGGPSVHEWAAQHFPAAGALLFIGAAGIAVRAVAPLAASKTSDPAVLVMDEGGRYVIPLLSGHIGGANALAGQLARLLGGQAVITTATDVNGVFAADTWAGEHGYCIQNTAQIKRVSAKLLAGGTVTVFSMFPVAGELPGGTAPTQDEENADVAITVYRGRGNPGTLCLTPPALALGVGCRKGTTAAAIEAGFSALCAKAQFHPAAFGLVCSIDLKREEPGLVSFCKEHGWPLRTFGAGELAAVPGSYSASDFVAQTTGVNNVCERAAVLGSGGKLLQKKTAASGVAMAAAQKDWVVSFAPGQPF